MKKTLLFLSLLGLLLLTASSSVSYGLDWHSVASGGSQAEAGIYTLESSIGQIAASSSEEDLCAGYLCANTAGQSVYLPYIRK